jgi:hypothetical protein
MHAAFCGPGVTLTDMRSVLACVALVAAVATATGAERPADSGDAAQLLARIGQRLEQYFARAQSIVCRETVLLQSLRYDLMWDGSHVRKLVYELRVAWEAPTGEGKAPEATVLRDLVSIDGRPPKAGEEPECLDPRAVSPDPLAMLLAGRQPEFAFTWAGTKRTRNGSTVTMDFKSLKREPPEVTRVKEGCFSVNLQGWTRGRVWVDPETAAVMRLDEHLTGTVDVRLPKEKRRTSASSATFDRLDSSIRYRAVTFHDPDETVMLPESIETLQGGDTRLRKTQTFSDYRRFVTDGRIVGVPEAR